MKTRKTPTLTLLVNEINDVIKMDKLQQNTDKYDWRGKIRSMKKNYKFITPSSRAQTEKAYYKFSEQMIMLDRWNTLF